MFLFFLIYKMKKKNLFCLNLNGLDVVLDYFVFGCFELLVFRGGLD